MTVQQTTGKDLILLVGTNPLPNYVVAKYLSDQGLIRRIFLVHSERTSNQANTFFQAKILYDILKSQFPNIYINLIPLSNVNNGTEIRSDIQNLLVPKLENSNFSNIHLNYTGGTKAMAVHIYNYFNPKSSSSIDSSYLSAQNHKLNCDGIQTDYCREDLRRRVSINIDTLLSLHYLCVKEAGGRRLLSTRIQSEFNPALEILAGIVNNPQTLSNFLKWFGTKIRPIYWDKKRGDFNWKVSKFRKQIRYPYPKGVQDLINQYDRHPMHVDLMKSLPKNHWLINENDPHNRLWRPDDSVTNDEFRTRLKKSLELFNGRWLEHYIASILNELIEDREEEEEECSWGMNLKAVSRDIQFAHAPNQIRDFEIDNFLIRGYQFFGISATTSSRPMNCKHKAFEIFHRSDQIGGDESRSILVCPIYRKDVEVFKIDLTNLMGHLEDKFLLICLEDWKRDRLKKQLGDFIWRN